MRARALQGFLGMVTWFYRIYEEDPYASCKPIKVCDVEDTVKSKCEGLAGCVAFNYDGSCGVLKTNSTDIKSPSDNGTMKVWYLEG